MVLEFFKRLFQPEARVGSVEDYMKRRQAGETAPVRQWTGERQAEPKPQAEVEGESPAPLLDGFLSQLETMGLVDGETLQKIQDQIKTGEDGNPTLYLEINKDLSQLSEILGGKSLLFKKAGIDFSGGFQQTSMNMQTRSNTGFTFTMVRNGQTTTVKTESLAPVSEALSLRLSSILQGQPDVLSAYLFQMAENSDTLQPALGVKLGRTASLSLEGELDRILSEGLQESMGHAHGYQVVFFREGNPADDMLEQAMERVTPPFFKTSDPSR